MISTALIISTYNWPEALACVLASVVRQRQRPTEVLVADDGSRGDTAALVARVAADASMPIHHIWHEDRGFRLAAIRNRAMAAARADYLIQVDGDTVLHPDFVGDHARFAVRGSYVQGSRAMLTPARTAQALAAPAEAIHWWERGVRRWQNAVRAPWCVPLIPPAPQDGLRRTRGANMAFWRDDVLATNGYDESLEGWGREDSEFAQRLLNAGVRRRNLKFAAVMFHLDHPTASQANVAKNHARFEVVRRERITRAPTGIDRYLG
ncbi:MAG: glycosyltransferase family 2 protein [Gemmatimonadaceae bacterium]|nr:glycosyltransferase family 2 protein [Gemmatimonadaceae bacterium]